MLEPEIKERTEKFLYTLLTSNPSLTDIGKQCQNLYGFWLLRNVQEKKLDPIVSLLVKLGELDEAQKRAKEDETVMEIINDKKTLEESSELTSHKAIAQLVELLMPILV